MTPTERILEALKERGNNPTRNGKGWASRCPAHDDRRPSLSINEGKDGRALVKCHAGCTADAICSEIGSRVSDLTPTGNGLPAPRTNGKAPQKRSANWTYYDAQGESVGLIVRWNRPDGTKEIRPVSLHSDGWRIGGMPEPRPLYCLPDLANAERVFIVEGEKAAEAARSIGLVSTTSAHGSKSAGKTDWAALAGKDCVILPDNDYAGLAYANDVKACLAKLTPAPKVRVVELENLPGGAPLPKGGDLVEWIDGHGDAAEPETVVDNLNALVDVAAVSEALPTVLSIEGFQPFPAEALPEPVRGFVVAGAKAIGCDPSFIALPLLACLARAIGNKRVIRLKRGWTEPAVIWAAIVGKSGTHKTPSVQLAMQFLTSRQKEAIAEYDESMASYETAKAEYDRDYVVWRRSKKSEEQPPWPPVEPACERFITSDTTMEALASLLAAQFDGLLVTRDELAGWLGGIGEYKGGKGSDLGYWLAMWSAEPLTVDRKTGSKKMINAPGAAVSLVGGIQPGVLQKAIGSEHMQDGLCARLLLTMPASKPVRWTEATVHPDVEAALDKVFENLLSLEPAADAEGNPEPYPLDLAPEAKQLWVTYYDRHRAELVDLDDDLSAAWSKLEAYTARFALIFQLCTWAAGDSAAGQNINEQSMRAAIELSDWFGGEAKRVYGLFVETDQTA